MTYRIEVTPKRFMTEAAAAVVAQVRDVGLNAVDGGTISRIYFIDGEIDDQTVTTIRDEVLADDVVESTPTAVSMARRGPSTRCGWCRASQGSPIRLERRFGQYGSVDQVVRAASGQRYAFVGGLDSSDLERVAQSLLANEVVDQWAVEACIEPPFTTDATVSDVVGHIAIRDLSADALLALSKTRRLSLDGTEMATIQAYFREQGRDPSDLELEMLAQTWSEHCVHKTFRALIELVEIDADGNPVEGGTQTINSMLKTLKKATDAWQGWFAQLSSITPVLSVLTTSWTWLLRSRPIITPQPWSLLAARIQVWVVLFAISWA